MDQTGFDDLARVLSTGSVSRRRAFQLLGAAVVGAPLLTLFPDPAAGSEKKRCRRKHGAYLTSGECNCAATYPRGTNNIDNFQCENTVQCACTKTVAGSGFCAKWHAVDSHQGCESDAECDTGSACIVLPGYSKGNSCGPAKPCATSSEACVNGTCQYTSCRLPCS